MRLYGMQRNSAGWRVRIATHLKGLPFDHVSIKSLPDGAYRRINPQGLMPALEIDVRSIAQSIAQSRTILELVEKLRPAPPLLASDQLERAAVRGFAQLIASDFTPHPARLAAERTCPEYPASQAAAPERPPDHRGEEPPCLAA